MLKLIAIMFVLTLAACVSGEAKVVGEAEQAIACPAGQTAATCRVGAAGYVPHPDDQPPPPAIEVCGDPQYETSHEGAALSWWNVGSFNGSTDGPWEVPATLADGVTPNAVCGSRTPVIGGINANNSTDNRDYYCHAESYYGTCYFFRVVVAPYRFWFLGAEERYRKMHFDAYGALPYWSECTLDKPACWPAD